MGAIRSLPDEQVSSKAEKFVDLNYVQASVCGWQHHMEDYTGYAQINSKVSAFFVLDGHGGPDLAELAIEQISDQTRTVQGSIVAFIRDPEYITEILSKKSLHNPIKKRLPPLVQKYPTSGFSMVVALIGENQITIANVGQCKCYVGYCSNPSKGVLISGNHTQSNSEDESRIKNAGGFFINGKVNGMLPYTRSIGDYAFKNNDALGNNQQLLVSTPAISTLRKQDMKTVILGSSGLWETPEKVFKEITEDDCELNQLEKKTKDILESLISKNPKEKDTGLKNMATIVIDLKLNK